MRLFDAVLSSPTHITLASNGRETILPGAGSFRDQLAGCPHRYALDDAAARAVAEEVFGGGKVIAEAVDIIRMPGETVWLEWWETPELYGNRDDAATRRQVGLLIEADATLRRGSITSFWKTVGTAVMLSPGRVVFDLDSAPSGGIRLATSEAGHPVNALFENARLTIRSLKFVLDGSADMPRDLYASRPSAERLIPTEGEDRPHVGEESLGKAIAAGRVADYLDAIHPRGRVLRDGHHPAIGPAGAVGLIAIVPGERHRTREAHSAPSGDLIWTYGDITLGRPEPVAHFVRVWVRDSEGWRIAIDFRKDL